MGIVRLTSYGNVLQHVTPGDPSSSKLYTTLQPGSRMAGKMSSADRATLSSWIQEQRAAITRSSLDASCRSSAPRGNFKALRRAPGIRGVAENAVLIEERA